jgi:hypothetical protein
MSNINWGNDTSGIKWVKFTEGKSDTYKILDFENSISKYRLKNKEGVPVFDFDIVTDKGRIAVTSWGMFFALKEARPKIGDTITIDCITKIGGMGKTGKYHITVEDGGNQDVPF